MIRINDLVETIQILTGENVRLELNLTGNLWMVNADIPSVEQALMNIVLNARDAMPKGGKLSISTENIVLNKVSLLQNQEAIPGDYVRLTIGDNGRGINSQVLPRIFEPFFTTKDFTQRKGLGLSVAYGVIKAHNGWINVTSELNKGSNFELFFPAVTS